MAVIVVQQQSGELARRQQNTQINLFRVRQAFR
jgi:hypothetical protein